MSNPTWTESWNQAVGRLVLQNGVASAAATFLTNQDTLIQELEGEYVSDVLTSVARDRSTLSSILSPANVASMLTPHLFEIARAASLPERDVASLLPRLRDYMVANNYSVQERNLNWPTITAAGGNTGNGKIWRLVFDQDGMELEGVFTEAKTAICRLDKNQVQKHSEVFEFRGVEAELDFCQVLGSGMRTSLAATNAGAQGSGRYLQNPSFETYTGSAPAASTPSTPTTVNDVTGWVLGNTAGARVQLDTVYRGYPGDGVETGSPLYAVTFTANNSITQTPSNTVRPVWDPNTPYYLQVAVYRASSCDGTLTLTFGSQTQAFAMSSLSDNAWNILKLDLDKDLWYKNWKVATPTIAATLTSRTTGSLHLDDWIVSPLTNVDGTWYVVVGGATNFLLNDSFTWTDALVGSDALINYWWFRAGWGYLPASASPTIDETP